MRLARALDEKKMDVRLRDKLMTENKITKDDVAGYQKSLVDETKNAVTTDQIDAEKRQKKSAE